MNKKINIKTYSTSQIAKIANLHPNTVRLYEEWGLIQKPERKSNGYRVFTEIHVKQFELAKKAYEVEVLQSGLRKRMADAVKLSAVYKFDEAIKLVEENILIAKEEIENAREAAALCKELFIHIENDNVCYKRKEAARQLGITIDTIRNWEMNGLITIKRKENGYRVYNSNDIRRLKIIRALRGANYSLSAILRMLNKLEDEQCNNAEEIISILNTPQEDDDIVSACDKLMDSLDNTVEIAYEVIELLKEIKQLKK